MKRLLTDLQIKNAKELYSSGYYTKTDLAREFGVSITTMCLWLNDAATVQKKLNKKKRKTRTHCDKCGVSYITHNRCKRCECLICDMSDMCGWCKNDLARDSRKSYSRSN